MNTAKALKEITEYGFTNEELDHDYGISLSTQANYQKNKHHVRQSLSLKTIEALRFALELISKHSGFNPAKEIREIRFESEQLKLNEFIKKFESSDPELLKYAIGLRLESFIKDREIIRPLDEFRKRYEFINDETLEKASTECPELLQGIILDETINPLAKSHALYALSLGGREQYYSFIKGFINHPSPFLRESACMGIFEYFENVEEARSKDVKEVLERALRIEKATGVKEKMRYLIENM